MISNPKDTAAGLFFIAAGLFFCLNVWFNLQVGTALRMGPGYFPIALGAILALLGLAIIFKGMFTQGTPFGSVAIRGVVFVGLAPLIFSVVVLPLGLVAAIFLSTFVASLSSQRSGIVFSLLLSLGLTIFCVLVFSYGLGLPYKLVGPWLQWIGG